MFASDLAYENSQKIVLGIITNGEEVLMGIKSFQLQQELH
jgi:hypothetical protein